MLFALLQPPASGVEEFFAWHEAEHVPGRLGVPGFLGARRYRAVDGPPLGLLIYDIEDRAVLASEQYRAVQAATATATAERMGGLDRFVRVTAEVVESEGQNPGSGALLQVRTCPAGVVGAGDLPAPSGWTARQRVNVLETNVDAAVIDLYDLPEGSTADALPSGSTGGVDVAYYTPVERFDRPIWADAVERSL
jgi:hypothetical protein